jgi:hypothetical protein
MTRSSKLALAPLLHLRNSERTWRRRPRSTTRTCSRQLAVCQEELKLGNVVYSLLIGAVLLESLQIAPKAFLELLRPDWVAPPEGKCGAAGTTSASDQIAGLPSPEGCFTMAMVKIRLGSQPGRMSESLQLPATPGRGSATLEDSAAREPVQQGVQDSEAEPGVQGTLSMCGPE